MTIGAFQLASGANLAARLDGSAENFGATGDVTLTESETAAITSIVQGLGTYHLTLSLWSLHEPHLAHQVYGKGTATTSGYTSEESKCFRCSFIY